MRNPSFPLRSPQSGCSPASSEGTPKRKDTRSGKEALQCIHFAYLFFIMGEAATYSETLRLLSLIRERCLYLCSLMFSEECHFITTLISSSLCSSFFTAGSRPPLILQSPPPYAPSPREGVPDQKQQLQQRKKVPIVKEEKDMYDIVSSPNKDSTKLTLKLSRVKSNESDPPGEMLFFSISFIAI